ncbi:retrovirus-related pol polyprotein from transposon TNT 1-94 [Tanacetum coccineum]
MLTLVENVIVARTDNRPPMLDKTQYSSWESRMLLYIKGKEHKKIREAYDIKATNTVLQGLPQDIYTLVNHHIEAKYIWDRVKLLIQGLEISLQKRESKLYDEFDTFTSMHGETIHLCYMSKFVTDVKLAKDLHNTDFDHLYAYLRQHEAYANEVRQMKEQFPNPHVLVANTYNSSLSYTNQTLSYTNPTPHNEQLSLIAQQFYSSFTPQQLHDVSLGRQTQGYAGNGFSSNATGTRVTKNGGTNTVGQAKVIHCYNCQEEGHMARQCTKPKRPRNSTWFKEKAMLAKALELGVVLDEEKMPFLADNGDTIITSQASICQCELCGYDLDVLSKVPTSYTYQTYNMIHQSVQEMSYYEQPTFINGSDIDITSDSNMISYEQYLRETKNSVIQDTHSPAQQDTMIMSVIEEMCNQVTQCKEIDKENKIIHESLTAELERYQEQIKLFKEIPKVDLNDREKYIDGQLRKMQAKQNDPIAKDEKINIMPIDSAALNKLSENFVSHSVPQKQLSVEQTFRLPISKLVSEKPPVQPEPVLKEIPCELPPISLVKDSFNKMRSHVNQFNEVIMETRKGGGGVKQFTG